MPRRLPLRHRGSDGVTGSDDVVLAGRDPLAASAEAGLTRAVAAAPTASRSMAAGIVVPRGSVKIRGGIWTLFEIGRRIDAWAERSGGPPPTLAARVIAIGATGLDFIDPVASAATGILCAGRDDGPVNAANSGPSPRVRHPRVGGKSAGGRRSARIPNGPMGNRLRSRSPDHVPDGRLRCRRCWRSAASSRDPTPHPACWAWIGRSIGNIIEG